MSENHWLNDIMKEYFVWIIIFFLSFAFCQLFPYWYATIIIYLVSSTGLFLQQFFHILHPLDWNPILHQEVYRSMICIQHQLKEHWYLVLQEIQLKYPERNADLVKICGNLLIFRWSLQSRVDIVIRQKYNFINIW